MYGMTKAVCLMAMFLSAAPGLAAAPAKPKIQIALLLDTSNSMDGLIAQAKSQLWRIVNEFIPAKQDGRRPELQVALYEYGNTRLSPENGWIRKVLPFTNDLDRVSEELFGLTTSGGDEYCGQVMQTALRDLQWSNGHNDLRLIFIAGNEPFTQGPVDYSLSCKAAVANDLTINTIFCGADLDGVNTRWRDGAILAGGAYMSINQDARVVHIDAPQDKELAELGVEINETYVPYGESGRKGLMNQAAQDSNAIKSGVGSAVQRFMCKGSANYRNGFWDLVDAVHEDKIKIEDVKTDDLPAEMRKLSVEERRALVEEKSRQRARIQARITKLTVERNQFIAEKMKEQNRTGENTLDTAMVKAIREQAIRKGFTFDDFALTGGRAATGAAAKSAVVWDIGASRLFDTSNQAYGIDQGRVDVNLQSPKAKCPTGLGHLASGRESVQAIELQFVVEKACEYWLHVDWEPGGSGIEQFAVRANDQTIGTSRRVDAAQSPNAAQQEQYAMNCNAGVNTITFEYRSGDGLRFQRVALTNGKE